MKTTDTTVATVSAPVVAAPAQEVIKPFASIVALLKIEGDRVTIPKGVDLSPSELALFINTQETEGSKLKSQARWAFYSAGKMTNGEHVQEEIVKRLEHMMSRSALYQLKSEATTLCPLIECEGLKVPLSLLKDAKAELLVDENTGKLAPMSKQTKAAKELIPLLKSGEVSQGKIRDIRQKHKAPTAPANGKPTAPTSTTGGEAKEAVEFGLMCGRLADVSKYLESNQVGGDDRQKLVNLVIDLGRKLNLKVA